MIHFRRELVDCEEEAGSPRFPPRWLVQCLQSRGTEKKEMKRAGWLQEEGGNSFFLSPLCFWLLIAQCLPGGPVGRPDP